MAADDLVVNIGGTSASYDAAARTAGAATAALEKRLAAAAVAQEQLNRAVVQYGAASKEAAAASKFNEAALARVERAQATASIASKRAAEQQIADARAVAAAQERQAAAQATAVRKIGSTAGAIGAAAAVGLGLAAKAAADFEAKMAQVRSLLPEADKSQTAGLADAAKGFTDIGVSATQAADAEIELVKAGISAADIQGGALPAALTLAAAGQLDVADATSIAAQAMTQFQLQGRDLPHVADLLAAGADKALGSVQDLGEGLQYSGLTAHQLGLTVDETVATLAEFAQAGLIGSQGGAAFQQMLLRLENPTAKSSAALDTLGISLYDAKGQFVGMSALAGQLHDKLGDVDQATRLAALSTIFGSRAVRAANVLYQDGAAGVDAWQKKVEDSGFAAEQAAGKMDSLQGDMQKLRAQVTNAAIDFGEQLQPALRSATQGLSGFVGFLDSIPGPLKEAAALTLAFTAAVGAGVFTVNRASMALASLGTTLGVVGVRGSQAATGLTATNVAASSIDKRMLAIKGGAALAGIALLTLSSNADEAVDGLGAVTSAAGAAALGFSVGGPLGAGIATGISALTNYVGALHQVDAALQHVNDVSSADPFNFALIVKSARATADSLDDAADSTSRWGTAAHIATGAFLGLPGQGIGFALDHLSSKQRDAADESDHLADSALAVRRGFQAFAADLPKPLRDFDLIASRLHKLGYSIKDIQGLMVNRNRSAPDAIAWEQAVHGVENFGGAARQAAKDAARTAAQIDRLGFSVKQLTGALQDDQDALNRRAALRSYADAIKAVNKAQKDAKTTTRQANEALDAQASAALNVASTMKQGTNQQVAYLNRARDALYRQARQFGMTRDEADKYVNSVLGIPGEKNTHVNLYAEEAQRRIDHLLASYDRLHDKTFTVTESIRTIGGFTAGGHTVYGQAAGGPVIGPGTGTSDSVLRRLSNGEHVWTAQEVAKAGGHAAVAAIRSQFAAPVRPRPQGMATGGPIWTGRPTRGVSFTPASGAGYTALVSEVRALRRAVTSGEQRTRVDNIRDFDGRSDAISRRNIGDNDAHKAMQAVEPG